MKNALSHNVFFNCCRKMGNRGSSPALVDEGIKQKSNLGSSGIPIPEQIATVEEFKASASHKDFLLQNLDSHYLAASLLEEVDHATLLRGFKSFHTSTADNAEQACNHFTLMNKCAQAGVKVSNMHNYCKLPLIRVFNIS